MRSRRQPPSKNACCSTAIASRFVLRGGAAGLPSCVVEVLARALVALACRVFSACWGCLLCLLVVFWRLLALRWLAFARPSPCLALLWLPCLLPSSLRCFWRVWRLVGLLFGRFSGGCVLRPSVVWRPFAAFRSFAVLGVGFSFLAARVLRLLGGEGVAFLPPFLGRTLRDNKILNCV